MQATQSLTPLLLLLTLFLNIENFSTFAAPPIPVKKVTQAPPAKSKAVPASWDNWYTITLNGTVKYGVLHETVSPDKGRYKYSSQLSKSEEGFVLEENVGAYATLNEELTPLFFNFRSLYRNREIVIDAKIKDGKIEATATRSGTQLPPVSKPYRKGSILEVYFPVWLLQKLPTLKTNQPTPFAAIMQDDLDGGFPPVQGIARLDPPDALALKTKTARITVVINNINYIWYVDPIKGPIRIEIPAQKLIMEKVPEEKGKDFLEEE